jgi:hypothetical protein
MQARKNDKLYVLEELHRFVLVVFTRRRSNDIFRKHRARGASEVAEAAAKHPDYCYFFVSLSAPTQELRATISAVCRFAAGVNVVQMTHLLTSIVPLSRTCGVVKD